MPVAPSGPCEVVVVGSGTAVGKTRVTTLLVQGLRALGRRTWVHKPISCGGWDGTSADDGRVLAGLCGDGQDPSSICPLQFPEPAAPSLAARLAGRHISLADLRSALDACRGDHDLVIEGAGGVLSPLSADRRGILDLVAGRLPALVVCTPALGTLNATALTVAAARQAGVELLGLILNQAGAPQGTIAESHAQEELEALCALPVLSMLPHAVESAPGAATTLAQAVLGAWGQAGERHGPQSRPREALR